MIFIIILISVFFVRAVYVESPISNEEYEISEIIRHATENNTDPYIIVSERTGQYKIDFLINQRTFLLWDLITSTEIYRKAIDESDLSHMLRRYMYSQLACNRTLQNMVMIEQEGVFNETIKEIHLQHKMGMDPMNIKDADSIYLIQYSGCYNDGNTEPCEAITEPLNAEILYEKNEIRLYFIDML